METNGSFFLKNLGKSSILVNGKAVASEKSLCLSSSSLIEVLYLLYLFYEITFMKQADSVQYNVVNKPPPPNNNKKTGKRARLLP